MSHTPTFKERVFPPAASKYAVSYHLTGIMQHKDTVAYGGNQIHINLKHL